MSRVLNHGDNLQELRIDVLTHKPRRHSNVPTADLESGRANAKVSSRSNDFVYVNNAYVGSLNSVSGSRLPNPPTSVIREQYWACSKWPFGQRVLAIAVGILLGAVIGLAVTVVLTGGEPDSVIGGIFRSRPVPD